jgi:hypothetical protein
VRELIKSYGIEHLPIIDNVCLESEVRKLESDYAEIERKNIEMALTIRQYEELLNALKP